MKIETMPGIEPGDKFTIEGFGRGAKGQEVLGGRNVATGRKCKVVALTVFKAGEPLEFKVKAKPSIWG